MSKEDGTKLSVILDIFVVLFVIVCAVRAYLGFNNRYFSVLSIVAAISGVIAFVLATILFITQYPHHDGLVSHC
mgnify:FL=1